MHKTAVLLLSLAIIALAGASANARNRLEVRETESLLSGRVEFSPDNGGAAVTCDVTLHLTMSRLFDKIRGTLAGQITAILTANPGGMMASCQILSSLSMPWVYEIIRGTLPTVTGGTFSTRIGFLITASGIECLFLGTVFFIARENPIRRIQAEGRRLPLELPLSLGCSAEATLITTSLNFSPEVTLRLLER